MCSICSSSSGSAWCFELSSWSSTAGPTGTRRLWTESTPSHCIRKTRQMPPILSLSTVRDGTSTIFCRCFSGTASTSGSTETKSVRNLLSLIAGTNWLISKCHNFSSTLHSWDFGELSAKLIEWSFGYLAEYSDFYFIPPSFSSSLPAHLLCYWVLWSTQGLRWWRRNLAKPSSFWIVRAMWAYCSAFIAFHSAQSSTSGTRNICFWRFPFRVEFSSP